MGRPPKFKSDEERQEARRATRRKYYDRERESALALERYHRGKIQRRLSRSPKSKSDELPLTHTRVITGDDVDLAKILNLKDYAIALQADLDTWSSGQTAAEAWESLTCRLMAAEGTRRAAKSILKEVALKYQLAIRVHQYAESAGQEAWHRGEKRSLAALERVCHNATRVSEGVSELVFLFEEGDQALLMHYEDDCLIWQSK
ncbi:hypothetical protein AURDEDRAFT_166099 [Auricularia subglabra TFB-10046 SS5]|nr:hypothetical protein AURDEDRAFT_166099 [Auricularia subglabra TFB-10046 SS5]